GEPHAVARRRARQRVGHGLRVHRRPARRVTRDPIRQLVGRAAGKKGRENHDLSVAHVRTVTRNTRDGGFCATDPRRRRRGGMNALAILKSKPAAPARCTSAPNARSVAHSRWFSPSNPKLLATLYAAHRARVTKLLIRSGVAITEADDLCNDVFVVALK